MLAVGRCAAIWWPGTRATRIDFVGAVLGWARMTRAPRTAIGPLILFPAGYYTPVRRHCSWESLRLDVPGLSPCGLRLGLARKPRGSGAGLALEKPPEVARAV